MKDSKTKTEESARLGYTGLCHSCCHTHLDMSVSEFRCDEKLKLRNLRSCVCLVVIDKAKAKDKTYI
jgi:hypothetical protein